MVRLSRDHLAAIILAIIIIGVVLVNQQAAVDRENTRMKQMSNKMQLELATTQKELVQTRADLVDARASIASQQSAITKLSNDPRSAPWMDRFVKWLTSIIGEWAAHQLLEWIGQFLLAVGLAL